MQWLYLEINKYLISIYIYISYLHSIFLIVCRIFFLNLILEFFTLESCPFMTQPYNPHIDKKKTVFSLNADKTIISIHTDHKRWQMENWRSQFSSGRHLGYAHYVVFYQRSKMSDSVIFAVWVTRFCNKRAEMCSFFGYLSPAAMHFSMRLNYCQYCICNVYSNADHKIHRDTYKYLHNINTCSKACIV